MNILNLFQFDNFRFDIANVLCKSYGVNLILKSEISFLDPASQLTVNS